ncbi:MAG: extracellular solute-binding protein, partial [Treponema sp.]|nr:extracellular solute-binding protein [Treponema sp.]
MKKTVIIAAIMASVLVFTGLAACKRGNSVSANKTPLYSPAGLSGDDLAFSKFTQPVDVHIGMSVDPSDSSLPPGDSPENNQYTRHLRDKYNINVIVDWTAANGPDFNSKLALCIASDTLPDAVVSPNQIYMLKAAKSGMLFDLTDIFEQYQSSQVRKIMESTNGRAKKSVSYKDRVIALPNITVVTDGITIMAVQKNWLAMYGLEVPKTLDDIEKVARVFRDRKPAGERTVPIIGPDKGATLYPTFIESSGIANGFGPVFSAYDAYPGYFLDNGDGTVSYGSLSPNMKPALRRLAGWYKEGLIDPEMGSRDSSWELLNANQGGIVFGPWWILGYGNSDSFRNNPNANWQAYPVFTDDGKWNSTIQAVGKTACLVSRKASADTAAAVVIMYNVLVRDEA